ncbi:diacylglycerol kinase family protein [Flavobacterium gelidilacus]|jgi:YegS/Rv2252/BmrU family lipid kinase|uniref:diacylglycerol/lipid kinase family protein n=1 Tax=Flavobacterium gelidilacus TaxID=206041 RepID=UPI00040DA3D6|nr:diacylglycerol kinase family protein [Flavobacterium gelidilacus]
MTAKKIYILVINPISGDLDKTEISEKTIAFANDLAIEIIVYETTGTNDESEINKLFLAIKPERIIIAGGDGTIKMVGEALEKEDIIFGIIPAGSANGLAIDLNLPTTLEESIKVAFQKDFIEIDMVEINNKKSLHLSDIGLNALLIKNYENGTMRGKLGYALKVLPTLSESEVPFKAVIEFDDKTIECVSQMIVIANSQKYGTGVTINPNGLINDGKFEIIVIKTLDLFTIGKIITGNMTDDSEEIDTYCTSKATITTSRKVSFQSDGEYYGEENKLDITILPNHMKIAVSNKI